MRLTICSSRSESATVAFTCTTACFYLVIVAQQDSRDQLILKLGCSQHCPSTRPWCSCRRHGDRGRERGTTNSSSTSSQLRVRVLSFGFDCCRSAVTELYFDRDAGTIAHHSQDTSIPFLAVGWSTLRDKPHNPPSPTFTHVTKESKATMLSATARASWQAARRCVTAAAATGARGSSKRALHASTAANATAYKAPLTEVQFLLKDVYNVQDR